MRTNALIGSGSRTSVPAGRSALARHSSSSAQSCARRRSSRRCESARLDPVEGVPGHRKLATRNIGRAKRRTANTAAALFIGVAIVSCLGVVDPSMKTSVSDLVDNNVNADYVVMAASMTQPISTKAVDAVEDTEGVGASSAVSMLPTVKVTNATKTIMPTTSKVDLFTKIAPVERQDGDAAKAIENGEAVIGRTVANDEHWKIGDTIDLKSENTSVDEQATKRRTKPTRRRSNPK